MRLRQLEEESSSQAPLVLPGVVLIPHVCWRDGMTRHKQSRRLLGCISDNSLTRMIKEPSKRCSARCDSYKPGRTGQWKLAAAFSCSDHEMVEYRILRVTLAGYCLEEFNRKHPLSEEWSRRNNLFFSHLSPFFSLNGEIQQIRER